MTAIEQIRADVGAWIELKETTNLGEDYGHRIIECLHEVDLVIRRLDAIKRCCETAYMPSPPHEKILLDPVQLLNIADGTYDDHLLGTASK